MEANLRKVLDASLDFITLINRDFRYEFVNESYCRQFDRERQSIEGKTVAEIWGEERFQEKILPHLERCFLGNEDYEVDRFQFGESFRYVQVTYTPYTDADGKVTHVLVYSRDLTTMKELESKIQNIEYKDPLTGLLNRRSFEIVLEMELEKARFSSTETHLVVLMINLKNLNRFYVELGPKLGDVFLESTGQRIKAAVRPGDFVFRMDSAHFAVILTAVAQSSEIEKLARIIAVEIAAPYKRPGGNLHLGSEIGFAAFPDNSRSAEELIRFSLSAVHEAQRQAKGIVAFDPAHHSKTLREEGLLDDIRRALAEEQFVPYFQPIVDAHGVLVGAESLIRWHHPTLGPISPAEFIPLSEKSGDITLIDRWMVFRVLGLLEAWGEAMDGLYVSVNLSAASFASGTIITDIERSLGGMHIAQHAFKVEVTETLPMENVEEAVSKIGALTALGVEVLIDDFGSGYSSLAYLKRLPARVIKIDKSFVDGIALLEDDRAFLEGMIRMINTQGRTIIVEGVETQQQFELLKAMGVGLFQGHLFGRAVPQAEFEALLAVSRRS